MSYFISAEELRARISKGSPVLLDLRFDPGHGSSADRFIQGHIPGALFVELESVFADPDATGAGNAPLPVPERLGELLRALGLDNDSEVIVYDDTSGGPAARAWWVLTWAGATNVRVLDGGLTAWKKGRLPVEEGEHTRPLPGAFEVRAGQLESIDINQVASLVEQSDTGTVIADTRGAAQFAGDESKPRTGHIPGARSLPQALFVDAHGRRADEAVIRSHLASLDVDGQRLVVSCGAGISSAYVALALRDIGVASELYPGSFSEWAADPARPVAQGRGAD